MKNFLANFLGLFTRNWGLKLLSLALAIVIYHALNPQNYSKLRNTESQHDRPLFQPR